MNMDFRMDKASYAMIVFILATMMYFVVAGAGNTLNAGGYIQAFGIALLVTIVLIALSCIPVFIVCFFIKRIPDIDYAVWVAAGLTVVGIISELIS